MDEIDHPIENGDDEIKTKNTNDSTRPDSDNKDKDKTWDMKQMKQTVDDAFEVDLTTTDNDENDESNNTTEQLPSSYTSFREVQDDPDTTPTKNEDIETDPNSTTEQDESIKSEKSKTGTKLQSTVSLSVDGGSEVNNSSDEFVDKMKHLAEREAERIANEQKDKLSVDAVLDRLRSESITNKEVCDFILNMLVNGQFDLEKNFVITNINSIMNLMQVIKVAQPSLKVIQ
jgi:hypothetical protein